MSGLFDFSNFLGGSSCGYGAGRGTSESFTSSMASQDAARAKSSADSAQRRVNELQASLSKTLLICEALWEMLSETTGLNEQQLIKKIHEIDMRDGKLDDKNQRKATECPECGRMVSSRHPACIYCGKVMDSSVFSI